LSIHVPAPTRPLHSFPTRRSSDLDAAVADLQAAGQVPAHGQVLAFRPGGDFVGLARAPGILEDFDAIAGLLALGCAAGIFKALEDRKSTRLNSSHRTISYAVFCLK